jgi:hypothetical protein
MLELTLPQAKDHLMAFRPGLYADFVCDLKDDGTWAYESFGAIVVKTYWNSTDRFVWYI